jgi:DNA polymerase I-like protein with 3'-5' exonuclease and polymerase domains
MLFQAITVENEQVVFANGKIHTNFNLKLTKTWSYAPNLDNHDVEYAQFRCAGLTIDEVCPAHLIDKWETVKEQVKSHCRACIESRIDITGGKFYNFLPEAVLLRYLETKNEITQYVFDHYPKPDNYKFLCELQKVLLDIEARRVNLDLASLRSKRHDFRANQFYNKVRRLKPYVRYNLFGTKTGRLTTKKGSFPILTMNKNYRQILVPQNDIFVELDYNAAELRTLLHMSGEEQPQQDIHDWNITNIFPQITDREAAKKKVFSWLYNPIAEDKHLEQFYNRSLILKEHWDGDKIINPFGRKIPADAKHALNYIIQSTTSDLFLRRILELAKLLHSRKSFISFLIHDSVVIDLDKSERHLIQEIADTFARTDFSKFLVNMKAGKNYGEMKEICRI